MRNYKYIFGPVLSRRLGISLGIDLLPYKTCSLDCIYCECGKTTNLTVKRENYYNLNEVFEEVKDFMLNNDEPDFITFSGSGEPTLFKDFGLLADMIKNEFPKVKLCLLTNSTFFSLEEVREGAKKFDIVLPSLDAATDEDFYKINRPHKDLNLKDIIDGLIKFRKEFSGKIWLEVFFAKNVNDNEENINQLYYYIKLISPDRVQLNTLDRPPAYEGVEVVDKIFLENLIERWKDLNVEIISRYKKRNNIKDYSEAFEHLLLNSLKRRPLTIEDLENIFHIDKKTINKYLDVLENEKKIKSIIIDGKIFISYNS
ncbi:MAG: radical SAM protein [Spirochaetes bacterium]|nr:radical SAM protein [Spirochaetota bacterium]